MTAHRLINAALFAFLVISLCYVGPSLDEIDEMAMFSRTGSNLTARERFERAAQQVCGPNAAWTETDQPGEVQCFTHKGRKAALAKL